MKARIIRDGRGPHYCPQCKTGQSVPTDVMEGNTVFPGFRCSSCGCEWVIEEESGGHNVVRVREKG